MTPIRPQMPPVARPADPAADAAKLAAQRAFFQQALGKAQPVQAAAPVAPAVAAAPASVQRMVDPSQPAPQRILRPGSLLDIRI